MCIILLSTAHSTYPYIIAANRDEYLTRPTAAASWWIDHPHVLAGRDLQRPVHGTWLGITRTGHIAALTNFREEESVNTSGQLSRGQIIKDFLVHACPDNATETVEDAVARILGSNLTQVGGFSLLLGRLVRPGQNGRRDPLVVASNRSKDLRDIPRLADGAGQTHGLSNTLFVDDSWPKVELGKALLRRVVASHDTDPAADREDLLDKVFGVLTTDTLPSEKDGSAWRAQIARLKESIFIPRLGYQDEQDVEPADRVAAAESRHTVSTDPNAQCAYGSQKQTVILVDQGGHVTFVERTLYDEHGRAMTAEDRRAEARFEFDIEGWLEER